MNITRDDAVELPTGENSIIATIYSQWHEIDLKTGKITEDFETVELAQGYRNIDNPEEFIFHYYESDDRCGFVEENISLNGYSEDVWHDTNVYETDDDILVYSLSVVTNYIMLDSVKIKATLSENRAETSPEIDVRYRTISGNTLWDFEGEDEL